MANAWGKSWGNSWGNSWGTLTIVLKTGQRVQRRVSIASILRFPRFNNV